VTGVLFSRKMKVSSTEQSLAVHTEDRAMRKALLFTLLIGFWAQSGQASNSSVQDISTEDIVKAYNDRFIAILVEFDNSVQGFVKDALESGFKHMPLRRLTDVEVVAVERFISSLAPYVAVNDKGAMEATVAAYDFRFPSAPEPGTYSCSMLKMTLELAGQGSWAAASMLSTFYHFGERLPKNPQLATFWKMEAKRLEGQPFDHNPLLSDEESKKLKLDWIAWSRERAATDAIAALQCT
jgi:hypothetical protein